jgi:Protein of unknown function (DUF1559)
LVPRQATGIINGNATNTDGRLPSGFHTGGVLVGMCDGSVRLVNPGVSYQTWWIVCTPAGGDVPGSDW